MNHLGSTAYVTDQNQNITQGFLYAPFGEITTEYNATFGNDIIPKYSFNAKELDEETGMYYYEARYYKPPVFTSRDAMFEKKPWFTPYNYCSNNPVGKVDPSGLFDLETGTIEKGDNLTKITKLINDRFNTQLTINDIAKANNIKDPNKIKAGDKIALPGQNVELHFDLKTLKVKDAVYNIDMPGLSWEATSGKPGYQSPEYQKEANKGPIPEGKYLVDPSQTQSFFYTSDFNRFKGKFGLGTWPGGKNSWGEFRTWLTPIDGTETYGRSGFSIHGGTTPGSAGCIDLTKYNRSFHAWLINRENPILLNVKY